MRGGGVIYNKVVAKNEEEAIKTFLDNATIEPIGRGTYGFALKATINGGIDSPFLSIRADTYMQPVTTLLLKIAYVVQRQSWNHPISTDIEAVITHEFHNEINTQIDIHMKTMNYLQPLCPAIVHAGMYQDTAFLLKIANQILKRTHSANPSYAEQYDRTADYDKYSASTLDKSVLKFCTAFLDDDFYTSNKEKRSWYGLISMEFADGYETLHKAYNDEPSPDVSEMYRMVHRYAILQLAMQCGYSHADFHSGNFMVNIKASKDVGSIKRVPFLLIDFGVSVKIPNDKMREIRELYANKKYCEALKIITGVYDPNHFNPCKLNTARTDFKHPHYYMCYNHTSKYAQRNQVLDLMIQDRDAEIDELVSQFDALHAQDPSKYPLLPIANSIKNQMYLGLFRNEPIQLPQNVMGYSSKHPNARVDNQFAKHLGAMYNVHAPRPFNASPYITPATSPVQSVQDAQDTQDTQEKQKGGRSRKRKTRRRKRTCRRCGCRSRRRRV
jgi:hypothetical protein